MLFERGGMDVLPAVCAGEQKVSTLCEASVQGSDACGLHQYLKGTAAVLKEKRREGGTESERGGGFF